MATVVQSSPDLHDRVSSILIIDDDPDNLALMATILEGSHYRALVAEDGESGVKTAQ